MTSDDIFDDTPDGSDYEEVIRYLMRSGKSRKQCVRLYMREVRQATRMLLDAIEDGSIQATGVNAATGKREIIPPGRYQIK